MRIVLLLLILTNSAIFSQNSNSSSIFIQLDQVEQAPVFPDCESRNFNDCSLGRITSHFIENLEEVLVNSLTTEEAVVILRFIVDREGKVRSPNVHSNNEQLKTAGVNILKKLPEFIPGMQDGDSVNVIVNIPLKIELEGPVSFDSNLYDSSAIALNCKNKKDPKLCTGEFVQEFFHNNFNNRNLKTGGTWLKSVIKFTIDEKGKVTNVSAEGTDEDFNQEGIKIIQKLPEFIPGTRAGKNIAIEYQLPILIQTK